MISLEEPEEGNAEGLAASLENALSKMEFTFSWEEKEIGICSDAASVNIRLWKLIKEGLGEHYFLSKCISHKFELAVGDAFKDSTLNRTVEQNYVDIYYFFKKSPLRWRLFKRQADFLGVSKHRYKRPSGTRWTEHSVASAESYIHNLLPLISYCDQQIAEPHNKSMKDVRPQLLGMRKNIVDINNVIFSPKIRRDSHIASINENEARPIIAYIGVCDHVQSCNGNYIADVRFIWGFHRRWRKMVTK